MADKRLKIDITAKNKTSTAFNAVRSGLTKITNTAKVVGAAIATATTAFGYLTVKTAAAIDETGKLSRQLGISTKQLETFKLAADLGGSSMETFAKASKQISKAVFDFVKRGTGEAKDAFQELGITTGDLLPIMNDNAAVFDLISDKFRKMENGSVKTATAMKIFGVRGVEMLSVFEGGSDSIKKLSEEAERFGLILRDDQVRAVEQSNDEFTRLKSVFEGITKQITANFFPALGKLATAIREKLLTAIEKSFGSVDKFGEVVAGNLMKTLEGLISFATGAGKIIMALWKIFKPILKLMNAAISTTLGLIEKAIEGIKSFHQWMMKDSGNSPFMRAMNADREKRGLPPIGQDQNPENDAVSSTLDTIGSGFGDWKSGFDDLSEVLGLQEAKEQTESLNDENQRAKELLQQTGETGSAAFNSISEAAANARENISDVGEGTGEVTEKMGTLEKAVRRIQSGSDEMGKTIAQGFEDAVLHAKNLEDVLRNVGQQIIQIAFRKAITDPLGEALGTGIGKFIGGFLPGGKQFGGLVPSGKATFVGEAGPELIVPNSASKVIPNHRLGEFGMANGVTVNQNITINAGVPQAVRSEVFKLMPFIKSEAASGVIAARNRGGAMATAMGAK